MSLWNGVPRFDIDTYSKIPSFYFAYLTPIYFYLFKELSFVFTNIAFNSVKKTATTYKISYKTEHGFKKTFISFLSTEFLTQLKTILSLL